MLRVLVCGGRDFHNRWHLFEGLDELHDSRGRIALIIHGAADGADSLAAEWAICRGIPHTGGKFKITKEMWQMQGRKAGPLRNQRMIDEGEPDLVVAFPGGTGTASMIRLARRAGLEVIIAGSGNTESC